jgi:CRP/FNR family transcriptional regulator, cyclic AMP receptor protein
VTWVGPAILFVLVVVASWIGVRWAFSEDLAALRAAPLFNGLSTRQLRSILRSAVPVEFQSGETIVEEGEIGDAFFLVKEGRAKVLAGGVDKGTVGSGGYFGEISLIDGGPRMASVLAETRVSAHKLTTQALLRAMQRYPSITRLMFLRLRRLLIAEGEEVSYTEDAPIDHTVLAELTGHLRKFRDLDWSPTGPSRRSRLRSRVVR